jgi:hypothetical protein
VVLVHRHRGSVACDTEEELVIVRRAEPIAGGLAPQDDWPAPLPHGGVYLHTYKDKEAVERQRTEVHLTIMHHAESND